MKLYLLLLLSTFAFQSFAPDVSFAAGGGAVVGDSAIDNAPALKAAFRAKYAVDPDDQNAMTKFIRASFCEKMKRDSYHQEIINLGLEIFPIYDFSRPYPGQTLASLDDAESMAFEFIYPVSFSYLIIAEDIISENQKKCIYIGNAVKFLDLYMNYFEKSIAEIERVNFRIHKNRSMIAYQRGKASVLLYDHIIINKKELGENVDMLGLIKEGIGDFERSINDYSKSMVSDKLKNINMYKKTALMQIEWVDVDYVSLNSTFQ